MLPPTKIATLEQLLDRVALFDLVRQERLYRDTQQWDAMTNCYAEDSHVAISWFAGTGRAFALASKEQFESGKGSGLHIIQPLRLWLRRDRAVVESHGEILVRGVKQGHEFEISSFCRMVSRAARIDGDWKLMSFASLFLRDTLQSIFHDEALPVDWDAMRAARRPIRFLSWLTNSQYGENPHMIADDEPWKVAAFYADEERWLLDGPE